MCVMPGQRAVAMMAGQVPWPRRYQIDRSAVFRNVQTPHLADARTVRFACGVLVKGNRNDL